MKRIEALLYTGGAMTAILSLWLAIGGGRESPSEEENRQRTAPTASPPGGALQPSFSTPAAAEVPAAIWHTDTPQSSRDASLAALAALAETHPDAAEKQALALFGSERDEALEVLTVAFGRTDPNRSRRMAEQIGDVRQQIQAVGFALAQQAAVNPADVYARLAAEGESGEEHTHLEKLVIPVLADAHPEQVAAWIADGWVTEAGTIDAVTITLQRWVQRSAQEAAAWMAMFDQDEPVSEIVDTFITAWIQQDAIAPAAWIDTLPEGINRDQATASYAVGVALLDPRAAQEWMLSVQSPALQKTTRQRLESLQQVSAQSIEEPASP